MPKLLCIETSTDICSVCISEGSDILSIKETERNYSHSEVIAGFIEDVIQEANLHINDIDAVAISRGPGSYTALRIGTATAKGICYALDKPLITINSLLIIAQGIADVKIGELIVPMIDARRDEVYHEIYDHDHTVIKELEPIILTTDTYRNYDRHSKIHFCGDGAIKAKNLLNQPNGVFHKAFSSSKNMVEIARNMFFEKKFDDIAYYEPQYYKSPNITVQKKNILR